MKPTRFLIALLAVALLQFAPQSFPAVVFTENTTIPAGDAQYDGQDIVVSECTLTVNGPHTFASLYVSTNAAVTHPLDPDGTLGNKLDLTILQNVTVELGGAITADGKGYGWDRGPGAGKRWVNEFTSASSGAGHGGFGGAGTAWSTLLAGGTSYGSVVQPVVHGSGGGTAGGLGGSGGGTIRMNVEGTLTLDGALRSNGISANPGNGSGGSGGSIWVSAGALHGSGIIQADGGSTAATNAGGGAGGRIAVYYATNAFTGDFSARGGVGFEHGSPGTFFIQADADPVGSLFIHNPGEAGALTPIPVPGPFNLSITGPVTAYPTLNLTLADLYLADGAILTHLPDPSGTLGHRLDLTILQNATVDADGAILADGLGYGSDLGPGAGKRWVNEFVCTSSGGGHGAIGGMGYHNADSIPGGAGYGAFSQPTTLGSGGGNACGTGGCGGGAIRVQVAGTLTVNGQISADGQSLTSGNGSGGAGGSIWMTVNTLAGNGIISVDGGTAFAEHVGGGAGGRLAVYYSSNLFDGTLSAQGGDGAERGGTGTIYSKASGVAIGEVLVKNLGEQSAMTPFTPATPIHLAVVGPAVVFPEAPTILQSVHLTNGAILTHLQAHPGLDLVVLSDMTVDGSSSILANGLGYLGGPGEGMTRAGDFNGAGSGASYGGFGGIGGIAEGTVDVRSPYGSTEQPIDKGSRGGSTPSHLAPMGGGAIRLNVAGTLTLDGAIRADALPPDQWDGLGGGSGGGILLNTGVFAGTGTLSAVGSSGVVASDTHGGGGGSGGRIAVYTHSYTFSGPALVNGGPGFAPGGVGTFYTAINPAPIPVLVTPSGTISHLLSSADVVFNSALDSTTVSAEDFGLLLPSGSTLGPEDLGFSLLDNGRRCHLTFQPQNQAGIYQITTGPNLSSLQGVAMGQPHQATFDIVWPVISGQVKTEGGDPIPDVMLLAGNEIMAVSDGSGQYAFPLPPGWSGAVRAVSEDSSFLPQQRSFANLDANHTGQDFTAFSTCTRPTADYPFDNSLLSTVPGAPALGTINSGHLFTPLTPDGIPNTVLRFPTGSGLSLNPSALFGPDNTYTIVVLARFDTTTNWGRILDYKNLSSENGLYIRNSTLQFYGLTGYTEPCLSPNTWHQFVVTRNAEKQVSVYSDGTPRLTFADPNGEAAIDSGNLLRFFKDNGAEEFPGYVSRIRIYPCPLSASQVAALDRAPAAPIRFGLSGLVATSTGFRFTVTGPAGLPPTILRSSDRIIWTPWTTLDPFTGSQTVTYPRAETLQFFKARWP